MFKQVQEKYQQKNKGKVYNVSKKYIPLHCFNKQLIVLQI